MAMAARCLRKRDLLVLTVLATILAAACGLEPGQASVSAHPQDPWQANALVGQSGEEGPLFCFIIRTYWAHGDTHGGGLRKLIRSLQRQNHQRWEAVLVVADSTPFPEMHRMIDDMADPRVWVFAEWIGPDFTPKKNGTWAPGYHGMLYGVTDDAIQVCPLDTEWFVVTNGDNEYGAGFIERVIQEAEGTSNASAGAAPKEDTSIDIVALDFYSRYLRITFPACERFAAGVGTPPCKRNRLRWCQSDLGAAAIRWPRFIIEGRRFSEPDTIVDLDDEHFDGLTMEALLEGGWRAAHVSDACLFVHAPSMQSCAWGGGVWDDRNLIAGEGGRCLTPEEAEAALKADRKGLEEVHIDIASDGNVAVFEGANQAALVGARCIRRKGHRSEAAWGRSMLWYTEGCVDDEDMDAFNAQMKAFYPDEAARKAAEALL